MNKRFRNLPGHVCPSCGSLLEILTDTTLPPGCGMYGDTVTCSRCTAVGEFVFCATTGKNIVKWLKVPEKKEFDDGSDLFLPAFGLTLLALLIFGIFMNYLIPYLK